MSELGWSQLLQGLSLTAVIGGIALWLAWHRHVPEVARHLRFSADYRARAYGKIPGRRPWDRYRQGLGWTLDWLDGLMGRGQPKGRPTWLAALVAHLRLKGLLVGYAFALGYTVVSLLLAWVVGAEAKLGDVVLMRDDATVSWPWRLLLVVALILLVTCGYWTMLHAQQIDAGVTRWSERLAHSFAPRREQAIAWLLPRIVLAAFAFALIYGPFGGPIWLATGAAVVIFFRLAIGVGLTFASILFFALGLPLALAGVGPAALSVFLLVILALATIQVGAGAVAFAGSGLAAVALANFSLSQGDLEIVSIQLLLFILLPWLNAFFDWISWAISRSLGRELESLYERQLPQPGAYSSAPPGRPWFGLAFGAHMAIDLLAALVLLAGLAWSLPAGIEAYNDFIIWLGKPEPLPLDSYLCSAAREPWTQGFWAGAMLFSTLLPTLLHLLALLQCLIFWQLRPTVEVKAAARGLMKQMKIDLVEAERLYAALSTDDGPNAHLEESSKLTEREAHVLARYLVHRRVISWVNAILIPMSFVGIAWAIYVYALQPLPQLLLLFARGEAAVAACFAG